MIRGVPGDTGALPRTAWFVVASGALVACGDTRDPDLQPPVYEAGLQGELVSRCGECHAGPDPAAGWSVETYLETIACLDRDGEDSGLPVPATTPPTDAAPIVAVLDDPEDPIHGELDPMGSLRDALAAWVRAGAPVRRGGAHPPGFGNPRDQGFHGRVLRDERWARMLVDDITGACGGCHAGSPNATGATAPGATSCASAGCHDQPDGPLDCGTCHGLPGERAHPPPDPCLFPGRIETAGAHLGHPPGVACSSCHPGRDADGLLDGPHGDGVVDVVFDPDVAGPDATFDSTSLRCDNACHFRGGEEPPAIWARDQQLDCNACHLSPPADHFPGPCNACHLEANTEGTAIAPGLLHGNGQVDLGTGSGGCGACHGDGDQDPWPVSNAHPAHREPTLAEPFPCESCHVVPEDVVAEGHLNGVADLVFGGVADARGQTPVWEPSTGRCVDVACHGGGLGGGTLKDPFWDDAMGAPTACGACHGTPPPPPHSPSTNCSSRLCHGGQVGPGPSITEQGRTIHVDGRIQPTEDPS